MNKSLVNRLVIYFNFVAVLLLSACSTGDSASSTSRLAKAQAMFDQRCKRAGERIYQVVKGVDGVFLVKIRPKNINYGEQFLFSDPYGNDLGGANYIASFLRSNSHVGAESPPAPGSPPRIGYSYVEAVDPADGRRYRYSGRIEEPWQTDKSYLRGYLKFSMGRALATGGAPRYGITYDDISTHEEREYWIAGSSLKIIDMLTNEVLAERVGYMIDLSQGSTERGRSPWLFAAEHACPSFARNPLLALPPGQAARAQLRQTLDFTEKVLQPRLDAGDQNDN